MNINHFFIIFLKYRNPGLTVGLAKTLIRLGSLILVGDGVFFGIATIHYGDISIELSNRLAWTCWVGLFLLGVGIIIGLMRVVALNKKITGILIRHRGMEGMDVASADSALPKSFSNGRLDIIELFSGSQIENGKVFRPESAIKAILGIPGQLQSRLGDSSSSDVQLAYAGLAPIPLLVVAGYMVSSRQPCLVLDFIRGKGWHGLDSPDDNERLVVHAPTSDCPNEVALVCGLSVPISWAQLPESLKSSVYRIELDNGARADSLLSETKQIRLCNDMYNFLSSLRQSHKDLKVVHIFMAAQASFCFRMGTIITASVHPEVRVYQYDPGSSAYSWGVSIKNGVDPSVIDVPQ